MSSKQISLITGGAGYFGSTLVSKLVVQGMECRVLDINEYTDCPANVEFFRADIRDYDAVKSACKGVTTVFHNVAQVPLAKNRQAFDSVNRIGTKVLLDACLAENVQKIVYTSSSAVFGVPRSNPVTEKTEPTPMEAYGQAKLMGEKLVQEYTKKGLDASIIRPRTIIGQGRMGIFQILFEWIHKGYNIPVLGKGDNIYQFVHADDLAEACILSAKRPGFSTYNCGAEKFGTMRESLENLCEHAKTGSRVKSVPFHLATTVMATTSALGVSPLGKYHTLMYGRSLYFDISKAKQELGWQPTHSNNEMLIESYEWYVKNREKLLHEKRSTSPHRSAVKEGILGLARFF